MYLGLGIYGHGVCLHSLQILMLELTNDMISRIGMPDPPAWVLRIKAPRLPLHRLVLRLGHQRSHLFVVSVEENEDTHTMTIYTEAELNRKMAPNCN